jgi:hypothetical protein
LASDAFFAERVDTFLNGLSAEHRALWNELQDGFLETPERDNTVQLEHLNEGEMATIIGPFIVFWRYVNPEVLEVFSVQFR